MSDTPKTPDSVNLVKELREAARDGDMLWQQNYRLAADEITKLRSDLATARRALQLIRDIVHTPTKATSHKSAERHFMADFDAIRNLIAETQIAQIGT